MKSLDIRIGGVFKKLKDFEVREIYAHGPVLQLEIAGYEVMRALLEAFCRAAASGSRSDREEKLYALRPRQVQDRIHRTGSVGECVMDAVFYVSGMTDKYAFEFFQTLRGVRLPHMLPYAPSPRWAQVVVTRER